MNNGQLQYSIISATVPMDHVLKEWRAYLLCLAQVASEYGPWHCQSMPLVREGSTHTWITCAALAHNVHFGSIEKMPESD